MFTLLGQGYVSASSWAESVLGRCVKLYLNWLCSSWLFLGVNSRIQARWRRILSSLQLGMSAHCPAREGLVQEGLREGQLQA